MDLFILFMVGLIFLTCLYGVSQAYVASWAMIIGLTLSAMAIGYILGRE